MYVNNIMRKLSAGIRYAAILIPFSMSDGLRGTDMLTTSFSPRPEGNMSSGLIT